MGNYWWYVTVLDRGSVPSEECEEILYSAAEISGSIGTEVQELPDGVRMRIYYRGDEELSFWRNRLLAALDPWPGIRIEDIGKVENQPWAVQSEEAFPPLEVGDSLVVLAPWHRDKAPCGRIPLYINPASAFGTGYHESTQVVLRLMERYFSGRSLRGERVGDVIDVGTGSGILTIAALKLGAERAVSRDLDPAVIGEAKNNLELNGVDMGKVTLESGDLLEGVAGAFDLVLANILADPLVHMLGDVRRVMKPGALAIFSGMIERERDGFLEALRAAGLEAVDELQVEDWWGVSAENQA
ncbi:MAG: 50S ribosomal protein L11 methyltransferase [Synergistaceae bacterium]|jgi:ribosomal protein L11 methyltransferase|nr:50S ribosomal protein L11 methyltransferase [Synergistaceae bacterium]